MDTSGSVVSMGSEEQSFHVRYRMEVSCLELALEGERLCKVGDYRAGVSFFEAAIQVGTEDLQVLSAIYSQLGNAYFHLHDHAKALEFHRHDLTLTRTIGDLLGEAKASGNLGNTLKVLGRFDEAVVCCQRHLDIARDINDKVGQARALYNFGNVYHAKGKSICWSGAEPGDFPEEVMEALGKAAEYYEANLAIVKELGDRAAQGRTYGNLGNTYYLLGSFRQAVASHEQRLRIAKEFGDRSAERRAYCNLGNAYIFLGDFEVAAEHYKMGRRHSMENLELMKLTPDKMNGQKWNSDILTKQSKPSMTKGSSKLFFVSRLRGKKFKSGGSSKVLQDTSNTLDSSQTPAQGPQKRLSPDMLGDEGFFDLLSRFQSNRMDDQRCSIQDKGSRLSLSSGPELPPTVIRKSVSESANVSGTQGRRLEGPSAAGGSLPGLRLHQNSNQAVLSHLMANADNAEPDDDFFDMLVKCQGSRLDDQRCTAPPPPIRGPTVPDEDFFSLIMRSQAKRMDEQRVALPSAANTTARPNTNS
ncbi:G-protein-signaling modulator 2-like [Notothenia coriiceps]|uniref:G-protein-signaling modulator 2-like n=1 Tax=Notothenia coriiceps TaxID=8208 RepID=A0A6I9NGM4_9TELE|nr:PREDICTED: G-protein-signaling modulator 2-like [Notothenia coriiceps]